MKVGVRTHRSGRARLVPVPCAAPGLFGRRHSDPGPLDGSVLRPDRNEGPRGSSTSGFGPRGRRRDLDLSRRQAVDPCRDVGLDLCAGRLASPFAAWWPCPERYLLWQRANRRVDESAPNVRSQPEWVVTSGCRPPRPGAQNRATSPVRRANRALLIVLMASHRPCRATPVRTISARSARHVVRRADRPERTCLTSLFAPERGHRTPWRASGPGQSD